MAPENDAVLCESDGEDDLYQSLFTNMIEGLAYCRMIYDGDQPADFVYLDVNPSFERITGLKGAKGKLVTKLIPGVRQANPELFEIYGRVARSRVPERFETYLESLNVWFSVSVFSLKLGEFVAVFDDISTQKLLENELREAKAYAETLIENANVMVVELNREGLVVALNPAAEQATGYTTAEIIGHSWFETIVPRSRYPEVWTAFKQISSNNLIQTFENTIVTKSGEQRHIRWSNSYRYKNGQIVGTVSFGIDITELKHKEQQLHDSEERFRTIADFTYDWEYWRGKDKSIVYMTPSCKQVTGYSSSEFLANPSLINQIIHPDDVALYEEHLNAIHESTLDENVDFRIIRKDGAVRWIAHGCRPVYASDKTLNGRRVCNRDITDRKEAEERANQLAYFDSLTGLPNRRMMEDRLRLGFVQAIRYSRSMAIMFLDLDNFKIINDTLGHDIGDKLLIEVAQRLQKSIRAGDTVARSGGDEFVIVLPEISNSKDASNVAEKILVALEQPITITDHVLRTSVSIGIAVYPDVRTDDANALMHMADQAMYKAKRAGRNRYEFFGNGI